MGTRIEDLPIEISQGELETRYAEWGDMAVRHARVPAGTDFAPVLAGLPNDRCPSPHWGIVLEGEIRPTHADGSEETVRAGELYHWPAGHTAVTAETTVFIEVGPVGPMRQFSEHAKRLFSQTPTRLPSRRFRGDGQWRTGSVQHATGPPESGADERSPGRTGVLPGR